MILILYGSQTGNSIYVAKLIEKVIKYGYNEDNIYNKQCFHANSKYINSKSIECMEMDEFVFESILNLKIIIFVCSTHGDGDEPFNMRNFWSILKYKGLPLSFISHLKFAIYGLGDSSYTKFNYCAKMLHNRLTNLGASQLLPRCDGDSQDKEGYMTTFKPWIKDLKTVLDNSDEQNIYNSLDLYKQKTVLYEGMLTEKYYKTPKDYQFPILKINFLIDNYHDFYPGDCVGILPVNHNYEAFFKYNQISLSSKESYEAAFSFIKSLQNTQPNFIKDEIIISLSDDVTSMKYLLRTYFDINIIPNQEIFKELSNNIRLNNSLFNKSEIPLHLIIEKLVELSNDYEIYYDYIIKPKRTFFEVLKDFSILVDIEYLINYIPQINYRYFTLIKNKHDYNLHISLVDYKTSIKSPRTGLCSEYLKSIEKGTKLYFKIGKSQLYFPKNKLIFICTGSGIGLPYSVLNFFTGLNIQIFYGFRNLKIDQLYQEILLNGEYNGNNVEVFLAPSRESPFLYVQEVFKLNAPENIDDHTIFVSGHSRLNKEIRQTLFNIYNRNIKFQSETW